MQKVIHKFQCDLQPGRRSFTEELQNCCIYSVECDCDGFTPAQALGLETLGSMP